MMRRLTIFIVIIFSLMMLWDSVSYIEAAVQPATWQEVQEETRSRFIIALIPEKNIFDQKRRYKKLAIYLSYKLMLDIRTEFLPDYGAICDAFLKGTVDAGFFGSFSYILTHARTNIVPIARPVWRDGSSTYSGYIFTRKDSRIETVDDMKDKKLALVHKATTAGYLFPLAYFKQHGIDNMQDYFSRILFSGSHDSSAWAVYIGEADIGSAKNHVFNALCEEDADFNKEMVILAESVQVPSNGLAVRGDLDPALINELKDALVNLDKNDEGRSILQEFGAVKFIETNDEDYNALYQMVDELGIDLKTYPYHMDWQTK